MEPVLVKVNAPVPEASIDPPLVVNVNKRSELTAAPVYWSVPPSKTKFAEAFVEAPILLLLPPLAKLDTESVPAEIVVIPV